MQTLNQNVLPEVMAGIEEMTALRRDLHAHPELGFCEVRTAGIAARILREIGCDAVEEGVGKTASSPSFAAGRETPNTRSPLRFAPTWTRFPLRKGRPPLGLGSPQPHARLRARRPRRGLLLAASALVKRREHLKGDVVIVIQPGEEGYAGARAMIEDGLFERFPTTEIYGIHAAANCRWASWASPAGPRRPRPTAFSSP